MENEMVVYTITVGEETAYENEHTYITTKRTFEDALDIIKQYANEESILMMVKFNQASEVIFSGLEEHCLGVYKTEVSYVNKDGKHVRESCIFRIGRELL